MKALTLHQPWATLVAEGIKRVETRSWCAPEALIGERLAIHAAMRPVRAPEADALEAGSDIAFRYHDVWYLVNGTRITHIAYGAVIATALLVDCVRVDDLAAVGREGNGWQRDRERYSIGDREIPFGDYTPNAGRWAWLLDDVERIDPPIPARGHRQVWNWD